MSGAMVTRVPGIHAMHRCVAYGVKYVCTNIIADLCIIITCTLMACETAEIAECHGEIDPIYLTYL